MPTLTLAFPSVYPYLAVSELGKFYSDAEIVQLADRDEDNVAEPDVIEFAIERAAAELEQKLAVCYPLPLQPAAGFTAIQGSIGMLLAEWVGVIARYRLWDDTRPVVEGDTRIPEPRRRYLDLLKKLDGDDPCGKCACKLLAPSVLTNQAAGIAINPNMPMVESQGTVMRRSDWDFGGSGDQYPRRHSQHGAHPIDDLS
jgi:phage gp36-like protein